MTTKDTILEIMVGAFKRSLIVSEMDEMNKIAGGVDEATKAHYFEFVKWLAFDGLEMFIMTGKAEDNEIIWFDAQDGESTLDDVYIYWFENIKDK